LTPRAGLAFNSSRNEAVYAGTLAPASFSNDAHEHFGRLIFTLSSEDCLAKVLRERFDGRALPAHGFHQVSKSVSRKTRKSRRPKVSAAPGNVRAHQRHQSVAVI